MTTPLTTPMVSAMNTKTRQGTRAVWAGEEKSLLGATRVPVVLSAAFREDHAVVVRIPVNFRRRNGRQMVLTCGGEERPAKPDRQVNSAPVSAVAKAYRWQEQLESGQYASLEELAAANGVDRTYVSRILRLTSLSPEIVEAILDGNEPKGISLAKLRKKLPLIWSEQHWD